MSISHTRAMQRLCRQPLRNRLQNMLTAVSIILSIAEKNMTIKKSFWMKLTAQKKYIILLQKYPRNSEAWVRKIHTGLLTLNYSRKWKIIRRWILHILWVVWITKSSVCKVQLLRIKRRESVLQELLITGYIFQWFSVSARSFLIARLYLQERL